jgi:hypothetical protein
MTDDDIINRAKDACAPYEAAIFASPWGEYWVKRFGRIIETHVREECARICEQAGSDGYGTLAAAAMIRASRGNHDNK